MHFDVCEDYDDYIKIKESINQDFKESFLVKIKFFIFQIFMFVEEIYNNKDTFFIIYTYKNKESIRNNRFKKIEKKIIKIEKIRNKKIILSKELLNILENSKNEDIKKIINENKNDKTIFKKEIFNITNQVLYRIDKQFQNENIYVLIKNNNHKYNELFVKLASNYKCLNIITFNVKDFKDIEKEIFEKYETPVIISNNKLKALKKAKYVINIDFNEKDINKFNLNREAIIFNISDNRLKNIKLFNGKMINNIELNENIDVNIEKRHYLYTKYKSFEYYIYNKINIKNIVGNNTTVRLHNL